MSGERGSDQVVVDKATLRRLLTAYHQTMENFATEQTSANIWPMLIGIGATLDALLSEVVDGPGVLPLPQSEDGNRRQGRKP